MVKSVGGSGATEQRRSSLRCNGKGRILFRGNADLSRRHLELHISSLRENIGSETFKSEFFSTPMKSCPDIDHAKGVVLP